MINDAIHGPIEVTSLVYKIINTPEFHRLKDIKQLGKLQLKFHGIYMYRIKLHFGRQIFMSVACMQVERIMSTQEQIIPDLTTLLGELYYIYTVYVAAHAAIIIFPVIL